MEDVQLGQVIAGKFVLREILGAGAMGTVFLADQVSLGRTVAVKVLHPTYARDAEMKRRFHIEARASSRVNHPNTIAVIDFGETPGGLLYLVMEYVRGRTLTEVMKADAPLPPVRVAGILGQVLEGLHEAHAHGVIHRDLKPDNVLVERLRTGNDLVKVLDFGIAHIRVEEGQAGLPESPDQVCGTPDYMSPEQVRGLGLDARSDVYAAGILLYELLTGYVPFTGPNAIEVCLRHLDTAPLLPSRARPDLQISPALEQLAMKALAKQPGERFASAADFRTALDAVFVPTHADLTVRCPACHRDGPAGAVFCAFCGRPIRDRFIANVTSPGATIMGTGMPETPVAPTVADARTIAGFGGPSRPPGVVVSGSGPHHLRMPLVGRDAELRRVENFLGQRGARSLLVVGPPGVGKTRIVYEALRRGEGRAWRVIRVRADASGAAEPWLPIRQAMAQLLDLRSNPSRTELSTRLAAIGWDPADLIALAPVFSVQLDEGGLEHAVRRRECHAAVLRFLRSAGARGELVLVFEDIDRYDAASRAVLKRLVEAPGDGAPYVIVTSADTDDIETWKATDVFNLMPLADDVLMPAVTTLLGQSGNTKDVARRIARDASGIPLHAEQAVQAYVEGGVEGGRLSDLISSRIQALPPDARRTLQLLSVHGQGAPRAILAEAIGAEDAYLRALTVLEDRGLVRERTDGTVSVTHPFIADVAYGAIPVDARRAFHAEILAGLDAQTTPLVVLAHHAFEAEVEERALELLEKAGSACQRAFDEEGAAQRYRRAWELMRWRYLRGEDPAARLAQLGLRLGEALFYAGDMVAVEAVLLESLEHASDEPASQARIHLALARAAASRGANQRAKLELGQALEAAVRARDLDVLAEVILANATFLAEHGSVEAAQEELARGLARLTGGDGLHQGPSPPRPMWRILLKNAELLGLRLEPESGTRYGQAALEVAARTGSLVGQARAHALLADLCLVSGRPEDARRHRQEAVRAMRGLGDRRTTAQLLIDLGKDELRSGAKDRGRQYLTEARSLAVAIEWGEGVARADASLS